MRRPFAAITPLAGLLLVLAALVAGLQIASTNYSSATHASFPAEFVAFVPGPNNPVFSAAGEGHWDTKIRERGWILREGNDWKLWYTGYDGTRAGIKLLGLATSSDGLTWTRHPGNPLIADHWVEDMTVVKRGGVYYMFAEGVGDHAQLLTSTDGIDWQRHGTLDIRYTTGQPLTPGPFGTPTIWVEDGLWHLFYERLDAGVWLATSRDLKTWTNVQDQPVLLPGPEAYDKHMIAMNQIVKHDGWYYALYHGTPAAKSPWNTDVARSRDLLQWQKFPGNPIVPGDKSSGEFVFDGEQLRLYTLHALVDIYYPRATNPKPAEPSQP